MSRGQAVGGVPGPRAGRFFYGWVLVAGLGVVSAMFITLGGPNFGLFVKPITEDLGIGQAPFGWAHTARVVAAGASAPFIGRLVDGHGARWPLVAVGVLIGLIAVGLGFVTAAWQLVAVFMLLGLIGVMGAGSSLYTTVPISNWFVRKRGKAMALTSIGVPVGIAISVPLTQWAIGEIGWRATWMVMGGVTGVVIVLIAVLLVRRQPEDMGLLPDNDPPESATRPLHAAPPPRIRAEYPWTRSEAVRTGVFWRLSIVFGLQMFAASTGVFRIPYFVDRGIDAQLVAFSLSLNAVAGAGMAFPWGS